MKIKTILIIVTLLILSIPGQAKQLTQGDVYSVLELQFTGPSQTAKDAPARDIDFSVTFVHESGNPSFKIQGFFDGDGNGGIEGDVFKVRFCPVKAGKWILKTVHSNAKELNNQYQGDTITANPSNLPGFWIPDAQSPGHRWYKRSDGTHPYILGNTHYSFLSGYGPGGKPVHNDIKADIIGNSKYFKKLRMGLSGDWYANPKEKPFLDNQGKITDWGDYSFRPNPRWFHERADTAVQTAFQCDLITDLILAGPDQKESRSTLRAKFNNGDPTPFLKYIAARYGSYPNVWICLCNEYEIKVPRYTEEEIAKIGGIIDCYLPYTTPVSVHSTPRTMWSVKFEDLPPWNDHQIIQKKLRHLPEAADAIQETWKNSNGKKPLMKPTINDELSYQGKGDKHTEGDTIEALLGAFLGGGYGTTGEKPGNKLGQYFRGNFNPQEHSAADNLKFLRDTINQNITFWKMQPNRSIFENLDQSFRAMAWPGHEYVLGTNKAKTGLTVNLPAGTWIITQYDIINKTTKIIANNARGQYQFNAPNSRAVLFHFKKK